MWYRTGSVAVANGSAIVTGAGTDFVANAQVGEAFVGPNGRPIEIASIQSATQLTLAQAYTGDSNGGQPYSIQPTSSFARDLALAAGLLLNTFAVVRDGVGQGLFPDGTVAAPGIRFAADQDTGIRRAGANALSLVAGGVDRLAIDPSGNVTLDGPRSIISNGPGQAALLNPADAGSILLAAGTTSGYSASIAICGGANANPNSLVFSAASAERMRITAAGNVGIGTNAPRAPLTIIPSGAAPSSATDVNTLFVGEGSNTAGYGLRLGLWYSGYWRSSIDSVANNAGSDLCLNPSGGNLLVGATSGNAHTLQKASGVGGAVLNLVNCGSFFNCDATGFNAAAAALKLWMNSTTGRSISAAGTINASGADSAEYVRKALGCGTILKGDVCGIDANGQLVRTWADARRYVVKSTDPYIVGGDKWADHLDPKPEAPIYTAPAYDGPAEPTKPVEPAAFVPPVIEMPVQPVRADGEDDDAYLLRLAAFLNDRAFTIAQAQAAADAQIEAAKAQVAYTAAVGQYQADLAAYRDAQAAHRTAVDAAEAAHAVALAAYGKALTAWEAELEAARQTVDRIAFSGQVPVNVDADTLAACEAALGDNVAVYLVAVARGAGIGVTAVREADMTLPLYMRRLGAVWAIRDGRPWIDVQHG